MEKRIIETSRNLRKNQTVAEQRFWYAVRNKKINNLKFRRQHPIAFKYDRKIRHFIADFYCPEKELVVEIDGGIHEQQKDYDKLRTEIINNIGMKVIRFTNQEVINSIGKVIYELKKSLGT